MLEQRFNQEEERFILEKNRRIYQEVIANVSKDLHKDLVTIFGPIPERPAAIFMKNLDSLVDHASHPGCLLNVTNAINNNPNTTKFVTKWAIPAGVNIGISYYLSGWPMKIVSPIATVIRYMIDGVGTIKDSLDSLKNLLPTYDTFLNSYVLNNTTMNESEKDNFIKLRGFLISLVSNNIDSPTTETAITQAKADASKEDASNALNIIENAIQPLSMLIICYALYKVYAPQGIGHLSNGVVHGIKKVSNYFSYPNPPEIIKLFTIPSKFHLEFAYSFYNAFLFDDSQRNSDERLKEILYTSKENEPLFIEARHELHAMLYEVYKERVKKYNHLDPSAFNEKGKANDKYLFKSVLKEYLESVILVPAYFSRPFYSDNYSFKQLIPVFMNRLKTMEGLENTLKEISCSIDRINKGLTKPNDGYNGHNNNSPLSEINTLLDRCVALRLPSSKAFYPDNQTHLFDRISKLILGFTNNLSPVTSLSNPDIEALKSVSEKFYNLIDKNISGLDCNQPYLLLESINTLSEKLENEHPSEIKLKLNQLANKVRNITDGLNSASMPNRDLRCGYSNNLLSDTNNTRKALPAPPVPRVKSTQPKDTISPSVVVDVTDSAQNSGPLSNPSSAITGHPSTARISPENFLAIQQATMNRDGLSEAEAGQYAAQIICSPSSPNHYTFFQLAPSISLQRSEVPCETQKLLC